MEFKHRFNAFVRLGYFLKSFLESQDIFEPEQDDFKEFGSALGRASQKNGWFTEKEITRALEGIAYMLDKNQLETWLEKYPLEGEPGKKVAVIMAGNIPAVGFHDFMCTLLSGNQFIGKTAAQDEEILPALAKGLTRIEPRFKDRVEFTKNRIADMNAVIATGSNNTARYFEYYFGKYPNIIRKNRNSVAVIDGDASEEELTQLGRDVFDFYGLGCRSVSKVYIPEKFHIDRLFEALYNFQYVRGNNKYANNYTYHKAILLMNNEKFLDNEFVMLKESEDVASPVGMLFYERYRDKAGLKQKLRTAKKGEIQAVVGRDEIPFGNSQMPHAWEYADGVDTLNFLANLAQH